MFLTWTFALMLALVPHPFLAHAATANLSPLTATSTPAMSMAASTIPQVPLYSQFADISSPKWQKVGCGITDLAMIINYYKPEATTVNALLAKGIKAGAYSSAGWTYAGLINVSKQYGFAGESYSLGSESNARAFAALKSKLTDGPVIVSVHYKFEPKNPIPHLVVLNGIKGDTLYYNDPAAKGAGRKISTADFLKAWKKRFIVIRPAASTSTVARQ